MPSVMSIDPKLSIIGFVAVLVIPEVTEFGRNLVNRYELHGYFQLIQ